jgi:transposase-like protein
MGKLTAGEVMAEFKQAAKAAYQAPSVAMARVLRDDLVARYAKLYPTAVLCFEEDFEVCIAHLHCPSAHGRVIRTTNLLGCLFLEERRRVRAAGTVFGERPVLKLMFGAVLRTSETWRGIRLSEFEAAQLRVSKSSSRMNTGRIIN